MELFVTLVNSFQPLPNASKNFILGVVGVLDKPLLYVIFWSWVLTLLRFVYSDLG